MDFHEEARSEELCGPGGRARRGQSSTISKSSLSRWRGPLLPALLKNLLKFESTGNRMAQIPDIEWLKLRCGLQKSLPKEQLTLGEVCAQTEKPKDLRETLYEASYAWLCCGSRLRKGEVFAYDGSIQNLNNRWAVGPFGPFGP